jgi:hypothetical protein
MFTASEENLVPRPPESSIISPSDSLTAEEAAAARRKFGVAGWRKYALLKHGNNPRFLNSSQALGALKSIFKDDLREEIDRFYRWMSDVEIASATLEKSVVETRAQNSKLAARNAELERLLGIQEEMISASSETDGSHTNKIQYVVLLEKKLSVATWEIEELRSQLSRTYHSRNDETVAELQAQLDSVIQQRDALLSERGAMLQETESLQKDMLTKLQEIDRKKSELSEECEKIRSELSGRLALATAKIEQVQRQRDDLLTEQRHWKREKEELVETLVEKLNEANKNNNSLVEENERLREQLSRRAPADGAVVADTRSSSRVEGIPKSVATEDKVNREQGAGRRPSASLKEKLDEWNKQRDRLAREEQGQSSSNAVSDGS